MSESAAEAALQDSRSLAWSLAPLLHETCNGRLGEISWFKADWQRGGAATGTSTYRRNDDGACGAVVKLPVGPRELIWLRRLQDDANDDPVVPRLYAGDATIGGYDLAWVVIEKFEYGPLGKHWHDDHVPRIAEALTRFHAAASTHPIGEGRREAWPGLVKTAMKSVKTNRLDHAQRWTTALKRLRDRLDQLVTEWRARPIDTWLHGDAHFANAMSRHGMDEGTVSLIDFAEIHSGHWVEDAVYLERQLWARPERLKVCRPVKAVADARRAAGLEVDPAYARLAMIRRGLLAATAPTFIKSEGHPKHLEACLEWLERALSELK